MSHHEHHHDEKDGKRGVKRKLCSLGTGEVVHVLHRKCKKGMEDEFDTVVQSVVHGFYHLKSGISDVRVCHPQCGEVVFILTFLDREDLLRFQAGPEQDALAALEGLCDDAAGQFQKSGTLMPDTHTLASLLKFLKENVKGTTHQHHDVELVGREIGRWFPRPAEYQKYIHWDQNDPKKYTRNLIFANEHMDVLLMCWPPQSKSSIHCHDESSCWVALVEGEVFEVQYAVPKLDKKFLEEQMKNPTGAVGRCGRLKKMNEVFMGPHGLQTTYANNDIGLHAIENRTDQPAYTLHVYAPGLRKIKIFKDNGDVSVATVGALTLTSEDGELTGLWGKHTHPDGVLDIEAWNAKQIGRDRSNSIGDQRSSSVYLSSAEAQELQQIAQQQVAQRAAAPKAIS